ncbi:Beta-amylase 8 [Acorus gramineus]|uniref:Beta-amylase n=1 Tax=Acorus gramineus TaxID=55184 RepID=A0AAV9A9Z3_ACOGR|nr:Beta-amylase 8 [Acorus gramineus]
MAGREATRASRDRSVVAKIFQMVVPAMAWAIYLTRNMVYFAFMRSFRAEFDDLFSERLISAVEIGLGVSGELKYPSFPERLGWRYSGIGEFHETLIDNADHVLSLSNLAFEETRIIVKVRGGVPDCIFVPGIAHKLL